MCVCYRLLVGAPKAKRLSRQKALVPGGLYSCDLSSISAACNRVNFDNSGETSADTCIFLFENLKLSAFKLYSFCYWVEDLSKESKENQWMGVTVTSQGPGGKVVVSQSLPDTRPNYFLYKVVKINISLGFVFRADLRPSLPAAQQCEWVPWNPRHHWPLLHAGSGPNHLKWRGWQLALLQ